MFGSRRQDRPPESVIKRSIRAGKRTLIVGSETMTNMMDSCVILDLRTGVEYLAVVGGPNCMNRLAVTPFLDRDGRPVVNEEVLRAQRELQAEAEAEVEGRS